MNATPDTKIWEEKLERVNITVDCKFNRIIVTPTGRESITYKFDHEPTLNDLENLKAKLKDIGLVEPDE